MAVQFAQPYRFTEQQFARMVDAGVLPSEGGALVDGVPYIACAPVRFSWEDYHRLGEIGVLDEDERVELIHGEVIQMTPVGGRHSTTVRDVDDYLESVAGPEMHVLTHFELRVGQLEPVPDAMVLLREREVRGEVPVASACLLVVEVSDSSVRYDRIVKREMYAAAGIAEYWVVDLTRHTVVVHRTPAAGDYRDVSEHGQDQVFLSPALGGREVPVDRLLI